MQRTNIEWVRNLDGSRGYVWNPVTGCENQCPYCYAQRIATRFKGSKAFPKGFEITYHPNRINEPFRIQGLTKIFVCSMGELFGGKVDEQVVNDVLDTVYNNPQHTFIFLTKQPERLMHFNPWPSNTWVGATATDLNSMLRACSLRYVDAKVKFVSFEPLLGEIDGALWPEPSKVTKDTFTPNWIIIGAATHYKDAPPLEQAHKWAKEIIIAADEAKIPVFIKANLHYSIKRMEFPSG